MSTLRCDLGDGSGNPSPSIAFMMASAPASMPPAKSPVRKRGATMSEAMRLESASVSVPCTPRPVWMRILRSCFATTRSTPSSTPLRPSFHSSVTRPANSSMVSGPIEGTSRIATCEPLFASKSRSLASIASRSGAVSEPVRSVTRALNFGTAMGSAGVAASAAEAARKNAAAPRARRPGVSLMRVPFLLETGHVTSTARAWRVQAPRQASARSPPSAAARSPSRPPR